MPDWKSQTELAKDSIIFVRFMHVLLGAYAYEWLISLDFEWDFITGKKRFRWPMIFYFANRYLLLFALAGIAVSLDAMTKINCQALYTFNQLAGDASLGLASINLSIRTMAIWSQNRWIVIGLIIVILGHWSLILQGVQLKAMWVDGTGCVITETNNTILAAIFIYSMCFDLIVLVLNTYKLFGINSTTTVSEMMGRSRLTKMIFADGLIYFVIAFLANLIATVFMLLNLNQIMSVIFNVPAAVLSSIVACRAVRRLINFSYGKPEVYGAHSSNNKAMNGKTPAKANGYKTGVHIQVSSSASEDLTEGLKVASPFHFYKMETFTHAEDAAQHYAGKNKGREGSDTDVEVDVERGDI